MRKTPKLLIVVDMQNDFVTGSLANDNAKRIIPNIVEKLNKKDYDYLIFTKDTHFENYLETQEGRNLPVKHCIKWTNGWEIIPELKEFSDNAIIVEKKSFGYINWDKVLSEHFVDENTFPEDWPTEIELIGTCTSICVASNATILKATYPEMLISIDMSCCADITEEAHNATSIIMKSQQINVF